MGKVKRKATLSLRVGSVSVDLKDGLGFQVILEFWFSMIEVNLCAHKSHEVVMRSEIIFDDNIDNMLSCHRNELGL